MNNWFLINWVGKVCFLDLVISKTRTVEHYFTFSNLFYVMTKFRRKIKDEQRIILI